MVHTADLEKSWTESPSSYWDVRVVANCNSELELAQHAKKNNYEANLKGIKDRVGLSINLDRGPRIRKFTLIKDFDLYNLALVQPKQVKNT